MPFSLTCPECDAQVTVPDEFAGKRLRCKQCAHVFRAGSPDVDVVEEDEAPKRQPPKRTADDRPRRRSRDERDEDDDPPTRRSGRDRRPAKAKKRRSALPLVIGLLAFLVLAGGGVAAYLLIGRGTPTEYSDPEGMFVATFPNPPEALTVIDPASSGPAGRIGERVAHVQMGEDIYSVTVLGPFKPLATVGPRWRDQQLKRHLATILTNGESIVDRAVTHDGYTGSQVAVLRTDGFMTVARVVASERYVLRAVVVVEVKSREKAEAFVGKAEKFLDTLRVGPAFGPPIDQAPPPLSVDEVAAAYRTDPAAADAKYKGRYHDLSARVTGLRTTNRGQVVGVESMAGNIVVEFFIPSGMDGFKAGDTLSLTGQCAGLEREKAGPARIKFDACQLLAADGSIARPTPRPPPSTVPKESPTTPPKVASGGPPKVGGSDPSSPKAGAPLTLTAEQRRILGKWKRTSGLIRRTIEFKADGQFIEMEEDDDGKMKVKDDHRRTFRFTAEKRFIQSVDGIDLWPFEVLALDDKKLTLLHERFSFEAEYERIE